MNKEYGKGKRFKELMKNPKEKLAQTVEYLEDVNRDLKIKQSLMKKPIIAVEEGSVDIEKLENDGFYVVVYKQKAMAPLLLSLGNSGCNYEG